MAKAVVREKEAVEEAEEPLPDPGTPDGTVPWFFGFISRFHLVKSPRKVLGKGEVIGG